MDVYVDGSGKGRYCYYVLVLGIVAVGEEPGLSNNEAEYMAVIAALSSLDLIDITVYSDSQLVVSQLNSRSRIKNSKLRELSSRVQRLCEGRSVRFVWIPRKQNLAGDYMK